ncbi:MAG: pilus assembly protein PilP [Desulfobacteraceae bacterium]|nr:pilus assembly protein PilP [Desulfobacteraceae bacterium]MBC2757006.1 pilus assembly protein PilP [Desulfobacteraceae bacterium]
MCKIYSCVISILFLGVCFSGHGQDADASDAVRYISNHVKIVRPEKIVKTSDSVSSGFAVKEAEIKIAAVPKILPDTQPETQLDTQVQIPATGGPENGGDVSEEMSEAAIREEVSALIGKKERFYSRKGRVDPFEPFLRKPEPEVTIDEKAKLKRRVPRTPLEKIDLSQLRLTAVLRTPTKTRALVQEVSGKGYVINEGTYIGNKGGQVSRIFKDRIMVEEKYLDVFGKISVREREMKLQQ